MDRLLSDYSKKLDDRQRLNEENAQTLHDKVLELEARGKAALNDFDKATPDTLKLSKDRLAN